MLHMSGDGEVLLSKSKLRHSKPLTAPSAVSVSLSLSVSVPLFFCVCVCVFVCAVFYSLAGFLQEKGTCIPSYSSTKIPE